MLGDVLVVKSQVTAVRMLTAVTRAQYNSHALKSLKSQQYM